MLTVASALESEVPPASVKHFVLTSAAEDVEMKRVLIHIASLVATDPACMQVRESSLLTTYWSEITLSSC